MAATTTAIFLQQPITIESEPQNNGSVVTLISETNNPAYMTELRDVALGWCVWITQTYQRKARAADAREENNQVVCSLQIQSKDMDDVLPELQNRLRNYTGRAMGATAGATTGDGMIGRGEEDGEIVNTT